MVVTKTQMRDIERMANDSGLPYLQMMENAGKAAFDVLKARKPNLGRVAIFCGAGNNGGDGFVLARLLREAGVDVLIILAQGKPQTLDAGTNFYRATIADIPMVIGSLLSPEDIEYILKADVVVDAIYGTGFHGDLSLESEICCGAISQSRGLKVALDLPSGVECDTGRVTGGTAKADLTIAFHAAKPCHTLAADFCGEVVVADIGIRL